LIAAEMLYECEIIGQNFNYDRDKIKRLGFIIRKLAEDNMLKAHAINPELPKNQAFLTSIYTEEPFYKDEGMYEGSIEDLMNGCGRDACVAFEVNEAMDPDLDELGMRSFFENFLMKFPGLYYDIERQGFNQDIKKRDELLRKYIEWDERCRFELFQLTGTEINVASPKQISLLLWENLKLPRKNTTGEEDLTALLNSPNACRKPEHRRILELILEDRRVRRTIANNVMVLPDFDGRIRTTYFPCLETGRTSTGQQEPPIRPSIEVIGEDNKKKKKALGTPFQTMTKHGDIGPECREQYIPDEPDKESDFQPYIFVQADSSQAEARIIFRLANDEDALIDIDRRDYHAWTASWFFGGKEEDYSKKILGYEHPTRFVGKTLRHAGHLGAGKRRAAITVNTNARKYKIPIAITEAIAERALMIFHARQPKIRGVFQAGVIECLKKNRQLIAPLPYGIDSPIGGKRTFFERWDEELFRQGFSYLPQRAVSDNTKAAALRIKERISGIR
ncbi:MAG: DNA polymerase, partial [Ignavibacteria bacterium]